MEVVLLDFDKTLYRGDCSFDFYIYCLRQRPQIIRYMPIQMWHWILYVLGAKDRMSVRSRFFDFLEEMDNIDQRVQTFWRRNSHKIRVLDVDTQPNTTQVIISASPEFLLAPIAKKLHVQLVIATKVDPRSGKLLSNYCYGYEKVTRFNAEMGDVKIHAAYSDSLSDLPMLELADYAYIVRRRNVIPLRQYQRISRARRIFI